MNHREVLGFDRKVELAWLDAAAAAASRGGTPLESRRQLYKLLEGAVGGDGPRSGRGKTVTVLARVWITAPPGVCGTRERALAGIEAASTGDRTAIHWAMCCATHPIFLDVAGAVGRLLRLQGNVAQAQVLRRVSESWGERSTLQRAVQRICRGFVEWGTLCETAERGVYAANSAPAVVGAVASRLLVEGVIVGSGKPAWAVEDVLNHPALFPFSLAVGGRELRGAREFRVERQGVDVDVVALAGAPAGGA